MATAAAIDKSLAGGISGLRQHMEKMRDAIKQANEKADALEKEKEGANQTLCRIIGKQQAIKDKIESTENEILKTEKRVKDIEGRLSEKELFLKESGEYNNSLKIVAVNEGLIEEKEQQVSMYTDMYNQNYEKYQQTKTKKIDLEQKFEITENRCQDIERRLNALKLELEYNLVEEGRRSEGCKDSIDAAFKTEKSCLDLQRGLDVVMKRKEIATKKINDLESQINRSEDSLEATNFERRRIEATIREVLLSAKAQYSSF